jgi:hypothetical protein
MIVKLKASSRRYRDLSAGQSYRVIGIEADDYRLINDRGMPYLYPPHLFSVVEKSIPRDWIVTFGDDGERYAYPAPLNEPGFFEDFHDGNRRAVATFWRLVNGRLSRAG